VKVKESVRGPCVVKTVPVSTDVNGYPATWKSINPDKFRHDNRDKAKPETSRPLPVRVDRQAPPATAYTGVVGLPGDMVESGLIRVWWPDHARLPSVRKNPLEKSRGEPIQIRGFQHGRFRVENDLFSRTRKPTSKLKGVGIMKRAAIYLRVSTVDQRTSNQEEELRQAAERTGWEVVEVYTDHGISGAKGRDKRPALNALCRDASRRRFDVVMAWSVDRLGRSLQDLVNFLSELHALKVDLFLKTQGIDTTTPSGKAMFGMLSVFADFERSIIQERVRAGLLMARREGKRLGRPPIKEALKQRIAAALKAPERTDGVRKIAKKFGVNASTVQAISREILVGYRPASDRNSARVVLRRRSGQSGCPSSPTWISLPSTGLRVGR
jgi:DNA invertase Pin-like site-specific DNA recombinase